MRLTDTHCHLNLEHYRDDLEDVLNRAWDAGVDRILIPGTNLESSRTAVQLADAHPNLFAAVGVHPNEATSWDAQTGQQLAELAGHPKVVAIGEIGLDYYRQYAPHDLQNEIFRKQLDLATKTNLPVIIHSRESLSDLWPILSSWQSNLVQGGSSLAEKPGVLHSYDGDLETARKAVESRFFIGVTGPVTFQNARVRQEIVRNLPLEALLTETDSPYLTPHPFRGRRNEPEFVLFVAEKLADLHHLPLEGVADITSKNADGLFSWRATD